MESIINIVGLSALGFLVLRVFFKYIFSAFSFSVVVGGVLLFLFWGVVPVGMQKMVMDSVPEKVSRPISKVYEKSVKLAGKTEELVFGKENTYWKRAMGYLGVKVDGGVSYVGKRLVDAIFSPGFLIFVISFVYLRYKGFLNFSPDKLLSGRI